MTTAKSFTDHNQRLADQLLKDGRITPEIKDRALASTSKNGSRLEDALIDLELVTEADLMRYIATLHRTQFVSSEKLFKATVDPSIVGLVSVKLAELHDVVPVLYASDKDTLSVAMSDPGDMVALKEVKFAASVKAVQPLVARPAAIHAMIRRAYHNDPAPFTVLMQNSARVASAAAAKGYARATTTGQQFDAFAIDDAPTHYRAPQAQAVPPGVAVQQQALYAQQLAAQQAAAQAAAAAQQAALQYAAAQQAAAQQVAAQQAAHQAAAQLAAAQHAAQQAAHHAAQQAAQQAAQHAAHQAAAQHAHQLAAHQAAHHAAAQHAAVQHASVQPMRPRSEPPRAPSADDEPETSLRVPTMPLSDYVATVKSLVDLIDAQRTQLEKHSSTVAEWMRKLALRLGVEEPRVSKYYLAGLMHDLGKDGAHHITLLNVLRNDDCRAEGESLWDVPRRLFAGVRLPTDTKAAVRCMYERYDGQGLPKARAGADIPEGGRLLALCDCYVDLTSNFSNPAGRKLDPPAALSYLMMHRGSLFDPTLLEVLRQELGSEHPAVLVRRPRVLLVDPDAAITSPLEVRLIEQGFEVRTVRNTENALRELHDDATKVVLMEADLEAPDAGIKLRARAAGELGSRAMLWIAYTKRPDIAPRARELRIDDVIAKPSRADAVAQRVRQLLDQRAQ